MPITIRLCHPSFHSPSASVSLILSSPGPLHRGALVKACATRPFASSASATAFVSVMAHCKVTNLIAWWFQVLVLISQVHCLTESELLLQFRDSLEGNGVLSNWKAAVSPCGGDRENWSGVLCLQGKVWGLKLEKMGLKGEINVAALRQLPELRTISLMNNGFEGTLPEINKLGALKTLYLSHNKFSGTIPDNAFDGMYSLKKLHLSDNKFSGKIPTSLTRLPRLIELMLERNDFEGEIPNFPQERLTSVNFSDNYLEGPIPGVLSNSSQEAFAGNSGLCGGPLEECNGAGGPKLTIATIIIVAIAVVVAIGAIIAVIIILRRRRAEPQAQQSSLRGATTPQGQNGAPSDNLDRMENGMSPAREGRKNDQAIKLTFLRDDVERFDMPGLLRASAEVLGSGTFGSTYKAALGSGQVMVVKRYRHMNNIGREDFVEHMRRLGKLSHPNVLPMVAFYYRKEEKLIVSKYVENVSLAVQLHGNKASQQQSLDWPTRLKIIKGVSKGLLYLYNALPSLVAPHGHLKSSNVILNQSNEAMLHDYALLPVVNIEQAQEQMIAYKCPEFKQNGRITKKTDVWSLGVLILEILTGKFPSSFLQQGKGSDKDLPTWVSEESLEKVFDKDMRGTKDAYGEMVKLLKIALNLCENGIDERMDIKEATDRIEEIKERDDGLFEDFLSSYTSDTDRRSSRGVSEDFTNVPMER